VNRSLPDQEWDAGPGLLEAVWRFRWLVVAATLVAMVSGFGASFLQETLYEGEARLLLRDPRDAGVFREASQRSIDPARYVRNQAEFVQSSAVLSRTAELIDARLELQDIQERVTAQPSADLDLITIRALDPSDAGAAQLANAVAEAYQQRVAEEVRSAADAALGQLDAPQPPPRAPPPPAPPPPAVTPPRAPAPPGGPPPPRPGGVAPPDLVGEMP
jgi:uncharacterized protein involved in exopolysaccharide biosynthesis